MVFSFFSFQSLFLFNFLSNLISSKAFKFRPLLLFGFLLLVFKEDIFIELSLKINMIQLAHQRLKLLVINLLGLMLIFRFGHDCLKFQFAFEWHLLYLFYVKIDLFFFILLLLIRALFLIFFSLFFILLFLNVLLLTVLLLLVCMFFYLIVSFLKLLLFSQCDMSFGFQFSVQSFFYLNFS